MNFKDEYKNEMDNIRADGYLKSKVLEKIRAEEDKKKYRFPLLRTVAAAACILLIVGIALPRVDFFKDSAAENTVKSETDSVNIAASYNDVYEKVKDLKNNLYDVEEYAADYDGAAYTGGTANDISAQNGTGVNTSTKGSAETADDSDTDYSQTTAQVEGVDEADIVKTDGKYIYNLTSANRKGRKIRIIKVGEKPSLTTEIELENDNSQDLYLNGNRLVVFGTEYEERGLFAKTVACIYDISNPKNPTKIAECIQDGDYSDSRLIGDKLYMISNYSVNTSDIEKKYPDTYVPEVCCTDFEGAVAADSIYINERCEDLCYTVICGFDITDGSLKGTQSVLGGTYTVYCSIGNIITVGYSSGETQITRYAISDGEITLKAEGKIDGTLLNQFSIDEYNGYFRFVVTEDRWRENISGGDSVSSSYSSAYIYETVNALYVLDGNLKQVGAIEDLAPDERVYSVRFMGDTAYFVTFRQVDPLFSADLSDPKNPKIIGSLKIPGFSNYLYPFGEGLLFGIGQDADEETGRTGNVKLSMFDISNPADVTESAKKLLDFSVSDALYSHKATLIDFEKNLIGFDGYTENGRVYNIYSYENGSFVQKALIEIKADISENLRGLYIGDRFYIVTDSNLLVYDLETFELIYELTYTE